MQIEDKVHITLTTKDVEQIISDHFNAQGITLGKIWFDVRSTPSDSPYDDYKLMGVNCEGNRTSIGPGKGWLEIN